MPLAKSTFKVKLWLRHKLLTAPVPSVRALLVIEIPTPPLMAMIEVASPTNRSGQLLPSQSTRPPATNIPPFDMKSLKLNVVAARTFTFGFFSRWSKRRQM